jgi:hypothetical protein
MKSANTFDVLRKVVDEAKCFPNWEFKLVADEHGALSLVVMVDGHNNYDPEEPFNVGHWHPVPIATYNEKTWRRWVYEQCRRVMNHEIGESLRFGTDAEPIRPFAPMHGPGEDPYTVHEVRSEIDALTTQSGRLRPGPV